MLVPHRYMPSWGPFLPLDDAPDPEFAMEHSGQGFITKELMIGVTSTESYNDFNADDIQASTYTDYNTNTRYINLNIVREKATAGCW